jgi:hypothetical protein
MLSPCEWNEDGMVLGLWSNQVFIGQSWLAEWMDLRWVVNCDDVCCRMDPSGCSCQVVPLLG